MKKNDFMKVVEFMGGLDKELVYGKKKETTTKEAPIVLHKEKEIVEEDRVEIPAFLIRIQKERALERRVANLLAR